LEPLPEPDRITGRPAWAGLVFSTPLGFRPLEADVFLPPGDGPHPVVLWLHGGGFRAGHRRHVPLLDDLDPLGRLTEAGFAVVLADYRLSGEARFPAQLFDVKAAIRWLRYRAADLRLDPDRVALWGESAGAHLAAMAGLTAMDVDLAYGQPGVTSDWAVLPLMPAGNDVRAVVDWYGPTDFATMDAQAGPGARLRHDAPDAPEAGLLGGAVPEVPDRVRMANPCVLAHRAAPRFLIMHGTADTVVPFGQSVQLVDALRATDAEVEFSPVPGAEHCFDGAGDLAPLLEQVVEFLGRTCGPLERDPPA
jgi:acetyl esterase/lipase